MVCSFIHCRGCVGVGFRWFGRWVQLKIVTRHYQPIFSEQNVFFLCRVRRLGPFVMVSRPFLDPAKMRRAVAGDAPRATE